MKLPVALKHTLHKGGGRIVRISRIEHECEKPEDGRSRDVWHFVGEVEWQDGSHSSELQIAPYAICYSEQRNEVDALMQLMSDYLLANGEWCDRASKHEGWYANERPKIRRRA